MKKLIPFVSLFATLTATAAVETIPGRYIVHIKNEHVPDIVARALGIKVNFFYRKAINGFAANIPDEVLQRLKNDSRVFKVEPDLVAKANALPWGLDRIDQRSRPLDGIYNATSSGAAVNAYVIDTGIRYDHSEFGGRASKGFDAYGADAADCNGHGTHVSGTLGGINYGVARNVTLKAVKVLDCNGSGSASGVLAGIEWVINNRVRPAVANMSLGFGGVSSTVDAAVNNMINAGVTTVIAAGNDNRDACNYSPGRLAAAVTIGATTSSDARASFSNYGNCVDLFAPGAAIESATHTGPYDVKVLSGTSMSAPHVAGGAALYLERHPTASPSVVRDALFGMSTKGIITSSSSTNNHLLYTIESTDSEAPVVALTAPRNGSTYGWFGSTISMAASASDNVKVVSVKFYAGGSLKCTDTTAPYTCSWRTPFFPSSSYTLQARAVDEAGNVGLSPLLVIRRN